MGITLYQDETLILFCVSADGDVGLHIMAQSVQRTVLKETIEGQQRTWIQTIPEALSGHRDTV